MTELNLRDSIAISIRKPLKFSEALALFLRIQNFRLCGWLALATGTRLVASKYFKCFLLDMEYKTFDLIVMQYFFSYKVSSFHIIFLKQYVLFRNLKQNYTYLYIIYFSLCPQVIGQILWLKEHQLESYQLSSYINC